jgi:hypothetical protein
VPSPRQEHATTQTQPEKPPPERFFSEKNEIRSTRSLPLTTYGETVANRQLTAAISTGSGGDQTPPPLERADTDTDVPNLT